MSHTVTTKQQARDHQKLVLDNIAAAEKAGDHQRAQIMRRAFKPILDLDLRDEPPKPKPPFNTIPL